MKGRTMSNLEKLELCAKVMEEYGNHGAAFYIREAVQEIEELTRQLKIEQKERSLYEEIVEGFDALQKTRPPAPKDYRLSMSPERREWCRRFQRRSLMKQFGLTEQDMEMIEALDSEEFSFEAMQERWDK